MILSHPIPLSHFNHFDHVAHGSETPQKCISKSGKLSPPALGLLCTAYHIRNSTSGSPLHLCRLRQRCRLSHTSVTLHMGVLPPKPLKPTGLRGNHFKICSTPPLHQVSRSPLAEVIPHSCSCFDSSTDPPITSHGGVLY